jgi:hypothetical protein
MRTGLAGKANRNGADVARAGPAGPGVSDLKLVCRVTVMTELQHVESLQGRSLLPVGPPPNCRAKGERGSSRMLAATDRRKIPAYEGNLSRPGAQRARPVFRAAYKELCTRIWIELELLAQAAAGQAEGRRSQAPVMSTAILRLELIVLVDSCRSSRWRRMLSAEQCDSLCSMLTDVLAALYVDSEHLRAGIAEAQDRVLDELLPESEAGPALADPACQLGQGSHSAVDELVSLIQAQAAARALP